MRLPQSGAGRALAVSVFCGLGRHIYRNKNMLDIPAVLARLFAVILIGLIVENLIFRNIEAATVRR